MSDYLSFVPKNTALIELPGYNKILVQFALAKNPGKINYYIKCPKVLKENKHTIFSIKSSFKINFFLQNI